MKLFQIENFEPVPSDEFYMIEEFKVLYTIKYNISEDDKTGKLRKRGISEARFIYFMLDHKSEFAAFPENERIVEALTAAGLPASYKISDKLQAAMERYKKFTTSRNLKLLHAAQKAIDELTAYFNSVNYTTKTPGGDFLYEPKDVIGNIANLGKVLEGLSKLEEAVRKEEGTETGTRGEADKGRLS